MFEKKTGKAILASMLARVPSGLDTRIGSVIYDALAPIAAELGDMYAELESYLACLFAETAPREYLILKCAERGITPKAASHAVIRATMPGKIGEGERFSANGVSFARDALIASNGESYTYRFVAEEGGTVGNISAGKLYPIEYIDGVSAGEITGILSYGLDEEDTDSLRARYFESLAARPFAGNTADYRARVGALAGVGAVKVIPLQYGAGTVGILFLNESYDMPDAEEVAAVQAAVDPGASGSGDGIAPIGHTVTVAGASAVPVYVQASFTFKNGLSMEECESILNDALSAYFKELAATFGTAERILVRVSEVERCLLETACVLDVSDIQLCTETAPTFAAENVTLAENEVPVRGGIYEAV